MHHKIKKSSSALKSSRFSRLSLVICIVIFGVVGAVILIKGFAAPNPNLPGDLNNDGVVSQGDITILAANFNTSYSGADINTDGIVNFLDLSIILTNYGKSAPACLSGECIPAGDLNGWQQVFTDDFNVDVPIGGFAGCTATTNVLTSHCTGLQANYTAVDAKWFPYPDGWTDSGTGVYYPSKTMSISGGAMDIYPHTENNVHMGAAPEPKIPGATGPEGGQLSGRYSFRLKVPQAPALCGYKSAFLLWPDSETWPRDGEIDYPEADFGCDGQYSYVSGYIHHMNGTSGADFDFCGGPQGGGTLYPDGNWHTYVLEWVAGMSVSLYEDGRLLCNTSNRVPSTPMHMVLQVPTVPGYVGGVPNTSAGHVQIDWVAVWKKV